MAKTTSSSKSGLIKKSTTIKGRDASPKSISKRSSGKSSKKPVARDSIAGRKIPSGYTKNKGGLIIPEDHSSLIPCSKLKSGFKKARKEIEGILDEIASTMTEDYSISEIELIASFSADGKFMGIGVGGAASIKFKIVPQRKKCR